MYAMMYCQFHFTFLCTILFRFVNADDFKHFKASSHLKYSIIRRDMNASITTSRYGVRSLFVCTTVCVADWSPSLYFIEGNRTCVCNNNSDLSTEFDSTKPEIVYGYFDQINMISKYREFTKWNMFPRKPDCLALHKAGFSQDGVYTIQPTGQEPVDTWCDMQNGGWTVFQRRLDGSEDFYRGWSDYVTGFGNRTGEYWLGLDNLHALTTQPSELHIYAVAFDDKSRQSAYARYSNIALHGPSDKYRLRVYGYSGSCGNPFTYPGVSAGNNEQFTTLDRDHDRKSDRNCAIRYRGAWWYKACHGANLNGYYYGGEHTSIADGVDWISCWGAHYSVKETKMKVKRLFEL